MAFVIKCFLRNLCNFDNGMDISDWGFLNGFFNRLGFNGSVTFPIVSFGSKSNCS